MLHIRLYLFLALTACYAPLLRAQVGIGTVTPQANSILDLRSTTQGLLIPRLTTAQIATLDGVLTGAPNALNNGMLVYNITTNAVFYWNETAQDFIELTTGGNSADRQLSNLTGTISVGRPFLPDTDNSRDIGSTANSWANIFADGNVNFLGLGTGAAAMANDRVVVGSNTNGTLKALTNGAVGEVLVVGAGNVLGWTSPRLNSVAYGTATAQNALTNTGQYLFNVEYGAVAAGLLGARVSAVTTAGATTALTVNAGGTTTVTGLSASASGGTNNYAAVFTNGNVGIGTATPAYNLVVNGIMGFTDNASAVANFDNHNYNAGAFGFVRLTGATLPFTITGILNPAQGKIYRLYNATGQQMTIANLNGGSAAANQIRTLTGADLVIPNESVVTLQYAAGIGNWVVVNSQNAAASAGLTLPVNQTDAANNLSFRINNTFTGVATTAIAGFVSPTGASATSAGVYGEVNGTAAGNGVAGFVGSNVTGSAGVFGNTQSGGNEVYGVRGTTGSSNVNSAGVLGSNGSAGAGVLGVNTSTGPGGRFSASTATGPAIVVPSGGGHLGVGTTSPGYLFTVAGSSSAVGTPLTRIDQGGTQRAIEVYTGAGNTIGTSLLFHGGTAGTALVIQNGGTSVDAALNVAGSGAANARAAIITGGNVGIGTAAPTATNRLQVDQPSGAGASNSAAFNNLDATAGANGILVTTTNAATGTSVINALSAGITRFAVRGNGEISTPSIHNNGGTGGPTAGAIASGTYLPAVIAGTGTGNVGGAANGAVTFFWSRTGNIVTVHGRIIMDYTSTVAAANGVFTIAIPFGGNFTSADDAVGVAIEASNNLAGGRILSANGTQTVNVFLNRPAGYPGQNDLGVFVSFQYEVQ